MTTPLELHPISKSGDIRPGRPISGRHIKRGVKYERNTNTKTTDFSLKRTFKTKNRESGNPDTL